MGNPGELPFAPPDPLLDVAERHWASMDDRGASETRAFISNLAERLGVDLVAQDRDVPTADQDPPIDDEDDWDSQDSIEALEGTYWASSLLSIPLMPNDRHASCALEIEAGVIAQAVLEGEWQLDIDASPEALSHVIDRGKAALNEMLERNVRLALYWANRYARGNSDLAQDLFQEAFEGLVRAVERWDALRGYAFSTYATWHVRQRIQRGLDGPASSTPVHIPVHVLESQRAKSRNEDEPGDLENLAYRWQKERVSWEWIKEEVPDLISLLDTNPIDEITERICIAKSVGQCLAYLSDREADILVRRYGLLEEAETLDSIGQDYGISRERIRQIETKALIRLRLHIASLEAYANRIVDVIGRNDRFLAEQVKFVLSVRCGTFREIAKTLKITAKQAEKVYDAIIRALSSLTPSLFDLPRIWITPSPEDPVVKRIASFEPGATLK